MIWGENKFNNHIFFFRICKSLFSLNGRNKLNNRVFIMCVAPVWISRIFPSMRWMRWVCERVHVWLSITLGIPNIINKRRDLHQKITGIYRNRLNIHHGGALTLCGNVYNVHTRSDSIYANTLLRAHIIYRVYWEAGGWRFILWRWREKWAGLGGFGRICRCNADHRTGDGWQVWGDDAGGLCYIFPTSL